MLGKLSIRNAKRQAKEYSIYFISIVIAVALLFSFQSLAFSQDIQDISETMQNFGKAIMLINCIVVFVMAWLIYYTMNFMVEKRSKELGMYSVLGIEKKEIANMFFIENGIIGSIALIIGIAIGTLLYPVFTSIIMHVFAQPYQIVIGVSGKAIGVTAGYFAIVFLLSLLANRRKIRKTKVYDLLYADKQNEHHKIQKTKGNLFVFSLAMMMLIVGIGMLQYTYRDGANVSLSITLIASIFMIAGIYLAYYSGASFLSKFYLDNKKRKYKKNRVFLYRNLTSKFNTMSLTMGTLAMLFTFTIVGVNVGLLLKGMLERELEMSYAFDIQIASSTGDFSKYETIIKEHAQIKDAYTYRTYEIPKSNVGEVLKDTAFASNWEYMSSDTIMRLSDYNALMRLLGYPESSLAEKECLVHTASSAKKKISENVGKVFSLGEKEYTVKEVRAEHFATMGFNGYIYCIVVPDEAIPSIEQHLVEGGWVSDYKYVVKTEGRVEETIYEALREARPLKTFYITTYLNGEQQEVPSIQYTDTISVRSWREAQSKSVYTIISFLAFYLALIFLMASATILAIQQLSDSEKYKYRYQLLEKLGIEEQKKKTLILKQLLYYFLAPMLLPIIISIPIVLSIGQIFTIAITLEEILLGLGTFLSIMLMVYSLYFIATFIQFERNIQK